MRQIVNPQKWALQYAAFSSSGLSTLRVCVSPHYHFLWVNHSSKAGHMTLHSGIITWPCLSLCPPPLAVPSTVETMATAGWNRFMTHRLHFVQGSFKGSLSTVSHVPKMRQHKVHRELCKQSSAPFPTKKVPNNNVYLIDLPLGHTKQI